MQGGGGGGHSQLTFITLPSAQIRKLNAGLNAGCLRAQIQIKASIFLSEISRVIGFSQ